MRNVALTQMLKNQHNQDADEMMIMKSKIPFVIKNSHFSLFQLDCKYFSIILIIFFWKAGTFFMITYVYFPFRAYNNILKPNSEIFILVTMLVFWSN